MAKYNTTATTTKTVNEAGGEAYQESPKLALVSHLLTSFVKSQFYRSEDKGTDELKKLISSIKDKLFIAKAAIFARNEYGMRSVTHLVAGELSTQVKDEQWTKRFYDQVIFRVDDMLEIASYVFEVLKKKKLPDPVKKGFAKAILRFDSYQLAKYQMKQKKVSLVDIVNLVHPIGRFSKDPEGLSKLIKGELKNETTQAEFTKIGKAEISDEAKIEKRKDFLAKQILDKKIGYFELLKRLKTIITEVTDEAVLTQALASLQNEKLIKNSKVLPFRFNDAINEIMKLPNSMHFVAALSKALDISLNNVPKFEGKTLIVLDESGSMRGKAIEIGSLFATILYKTNDSLLMTFSNDARYRTLNPFDSTLSIANTLQRDSIMAGTNFHSMFHKLGQPVDRIIILSDMQGWMGWDSPVKTFNQYKKLYKCNPFVYSFDLTGYGTLQFPESNIFCIAGFSDKIFDTIKLLETDRNALINKIEAIEI